MKKLIITTALSMVIHFAFAQGLSKDEKRFAIKFLKDSEYLLLDVIEDLSPAQLSFKPSPDAWSIEETLKHIAVSEDKIAKMLHQTIEQPAKTDKTTKMSDDQIINMVQSREKKFKTSEQFEPANAPYFTAKEATNSFKLNREMLITFIRSTKENLRGFMAATPAGEMDAYQLALFIGSHSNRHRTQIEEIKAHTDFPAY